MAKHWWQKWIPGAARPARRAQTFRPRLEALESIIAPALSISGLSFNTPTVAEGGSATLSGTYTATGTIGDVSLTITWGDGTTTSQAVSPGTNVPFSIAHTFLDDNPTGTPTDVHTVTATLSDSGPSVIDNTPDGGGYRVYDVAALDINLGVALDTVGATSGVTSVGLDNNNDTVVQATLGGSFTFYGTQFTAVNISENGLITFGGTTATGANTTLAALANRAAIAPFWDDLQTNTSAFDRVLQKNLDLDGDGQFDYTIFEWSREPHVGQPAADTVTFQVLLQLGTGATVNGDIIFNYVDTTFGNATFDFGASATIGIKGLTPITGTSGVTEFAGGGARFRDGQAIRFSSSNTFTITSLAGPEGFGYQAFPVPFESRIDLQTAPVPPNPTNGNFQILGGAGAFNDISANVAANLGTNTFNFYGVLYNNTSTIGVSDNGLITFTAANNSNANSDLTTTPPEPAIAVLWDDWNGVPPAAVFGRILDFDGDGQGEYLLIEWSNVQNNGALGQTATFQALLELNTGTFDPGDIYLNYKDTDVQNANFSSGASATVGIKDAGNQGPRRLVVHNAATANTNLATGRAVGIVQVGSVAATTTITVNNVAPAFVAGSLGAATINEGDQFLRTVNFTDPSGTAVAGDTFTATVNWGDGSAPQNLTLPLGTRSINLAHFYGDNGTFTITISNLVDDDTGAAPNATITVTVNNVAPTVVAAPDQLIRPGQILVLDNSTPANPFIATFTDPGFTVNATQETFTTTIDWGDGQTTTIPPNTPNGTQTVTNGGPNVLTSGTIAARHLYTGRGTFTVTITVRDDDGGVGTDFLLVSVGSEDIFVVAPDVGIEPLVQAFDSKVKVKTFSEYAYDRSFRGGVRVATADVDGDSLADIITAPGPGGGPHIKVYDGATGLVITQFMAFDPAFRGGVFVAAGDTNGDGKAEVIVGAGQGGGPHVRAFDISRGNALMFDGFVYGGGFRGGVRVAAGDVNADGRFDIITAPGIGGGPHVQAFSGLNGALLRSFYAYDPAYTGGVFVASADLNGDGRAEIITGPGIGGGPHLRVFDGGTTALLQDANVFNPGTPGNGQANQGNLWTAGLRVATSDLSLDGTPDILVGPGPGRPPTVRALDGTNLAIVLEFTQILDPIFLGGVFLAGK